MKRVEGRPGLRVKALSTEELKKTSGGRGSYCGGTMHCDCGFVGDYWSFVIDLSSIGAGCLNMCPMCYADPYT